MKEVRDLERCPALNRQEVDQRRVRLQENNTQAGSMIRTWKGNKLQNKTGKAEKRSKAFSFIIPFILMCTQIFCTSSDVNMWKPENLLRKAAGKIFLKGLGNKLTPIYRLQLPNISADLFHSVSAFTKWFFSKFFYFIAASKMFHFSS